MDKFIAWVCKNCPEEVKSMRNSNHGVSDEEVNPYHVEGDVWTHTMLVCNNAKNSSNVVKLTALLHDIGKPAARTVIDADKPKPVYN